MKLTESQLWALIESAEWEKDHDYKRIAEYYSKFQSYVLEELEEFVNDKMGALNAKFIGAWLGNPGIEVSDDGWSDLRAEVVGRGQEFYENITVKKLQKMALENDYTENFMYSFQKDEE